MAKSQGEYVVADLNPAHKAGFFFSGIFVASYPIVPPTIHPRAHCLVAATCIFGMAGAQHITGSLPPGSATDGLIHLRISMGSSTRALDSTTIRPDGHFAFQPRTFQTGFYDLVINDSDRVDIILVPGEKNVELAFNGTPLQRHLSVVRSDENKRLWEYKLVSKESQAIQAAATADRHGLQVNDFARMRELDSISARAVQLKQAHLQGIINGFPNSYLAKVIRADQGLDDARDKNPLAVMKVFDFSDPSLVHSSIYDKAVMTFLRNIHASSEEQFISASDSLIGYASRDPDCRAYMIEHLIDLFSTYGPELPLDHIIDHYVVSTEAIAMMDPALRAKVTEIRKVSVGAEAPDLDLPVVDGPPIPLYAVVKEHRYTVLFFYGSTCDHCHKEIPVLKEVWNAFRPKGVQVLGIALDPDSTEFRKTIDEMELPWPAYSEFNGWGSKLAKALRVRATPWFYVLDRNMRIVAKPVDATALGLWLNEHVK